MRNLVVSAATERQITGLPEIVSHCAWDFESGGAYVCTSTGAISFVPPNELQVRCGRRSVPAMPPHFVHGINSYDFGTHDIHLFVPTGRLDSGLGGGPTVR